MATLIGQKIVWGVTEPRPIVGAVPGRQRIRMRAKAAAVLFVRAEDGIRKFYLNDLGHAWSPSLEIGRNHRPS